MLDERSGLDDTQRLMGHAYDGIREYDNPLPAWWVWLFIGSIAYCVPYLFWYHFGIGPSVAEEYVADMGAFYEAQSEMLGNLEADQATILAFKDDENMMMGMSSMFRANCATCHGADGAGVTGPNLTDDFYINIKSIDDIHGVLHDGVIDKGMPAWAGNLNDNQMVLMTSYVAALRETDPAGGKAAQGSRIPAWPEGTPAAADEQDSGE